MIELFYKKIFINFYQNKIKYYKINNYFEKLDLGLFKSSNFNYILIYIKSLIFLKVKIVYKNLMEKN